MTNVFGNVGDHPKPLPHLHIAFPSISESQDRITNGQSQGISPLHKDLPPHYPLIMVGFVRSCNLVEDRRHCKYFVLYGRMVSPEPRILSTSTRTDICILTIY